MTPDLAKNSILEGIGYTPKGPESQIYRVDEHDLSLIATAEITIGGAYSDYIFESSELPLLVAGISHCFRTEAGSGGRESKGLYRVHQFSKVELFAFCAPKDSEALHTKILAIEEEVFQGLGLPYRVIDIASGDMGAPAYRKFDIEAWMPGRGPSGSYGEVTSTSNCLDFQSRRLKIRYRHPDMEKPEFVHTLNGTAIANSRAIVALLENYQQADGTILMPEALQPYLPFKKIG
jgi:seryl-tRNA synthetase